MSATLNSLDLSRTRKAIERLDELDERFFSLDFSKEESREAGRQVLSEIDAQMLTIGEAFQEDTKDRNPRHTIAKPCAHELGLFRKWAFEGKEVTQ